jgi:hypothetical protein
MELKSYAIAKMKEKDKPGSLNKPSNKIIQRL